MAGQRKLETILTENKLVSAEQLKQIANYAYAVGIDLHEAVLQKKIAPPDTVMMAYAESIGLPFIHLADTSIDEEVAAQVDPITARQYSFVPISIDQGQVLLATTKPVVPDVEEELRMIFSLPVRCTICTHAELTAALAKYYPRDSSRIIKTDRGKVSPPRPDAKKAASVEPVNDDEKKNRILLTIVAFNFSLAFVCFGMYFFHIPKGLHNTGYHIPLIVLIGTVVGGSMAFVVWNILSRSTASRR